jgi:hypothetical protein
MSEWKDATEIQKGALIRFLTKNPGNAGGAYLDTSAGLFAQNGGIDKFGGPYKEKEFPSDTNIRTMKDILVSLGSPLFDLLGLNFSSTVTDIDIGLLFNNDPTLKTNDRSRISEASRYIAIRGGPEISRELGIDKKEYERDLENSAITSPKNFLEKKNEDLRNIDQKSLTVYRESFGKYYGDYKYPIDEAKVKARQDQHMYHQLLMKQHNAVYDSKLTSDAEKRIVQNVK